MKISLLKSYMPIIATGMLALSACDSTPKSNCQRYFANKPRNEYEEFVKDKSRPFLQSKLDSAVYRDLFETTPQSKDSTNMADFTKIANNTRGYTTDTDNPTDILYHIRMSLKKSNITTQEYKPFSGILTTIFRCVSSVQHQADKWAYGKFFEKLGLMKNQDFAKKFEEEAKKIEPFS